MKSTSCLMFALFLAVGVFAMADDNAGFFVEVEGYYARPQINEEWVSVFPAGVDRGGVRKNVEFDSELTPAITLGVRTKEAGTFSLRYWGYSDDQRESISTGVDNMHYRYFRQNSLWAYMDGEAEMDFALVEFLWSGHLIKSERSYLIGGTGLRYFDYDYDSEIDLLDASMTAGGWASAHSEGDGIGLLGMIQGGYIVNDVFSINGRGIMGAVETDLSSRLDGEDGIASDVYQARGSQDDIVIQWNARLSFDFDFKSGFNFGFGYDASAFGAIGLDPNGRGREAVDFSGFFLNLGWDFSK